MSLNRFTQEIKERGVAKSSNFVVQFMPPEFLDAPQSTLEIVSLLCEGTAFPEFALATSTIKDYGVNREVVYDKLYGTLPLTFICDQGMYIKQFFDTWIQGIAPYRGGLFEYPDKYTAPWIIINQLDAAKNVVYYVKLHHIYPKIVNDIQMSYGGREYSKFQVLFTYESWESGIRQDDNISDSMRASKSLYNSYRDGIIFATKPISPVPVDAIYDLFGDANDIIGGIGGGIGSGIIPSPSELNPLLPIISDAITGNGGTGSNVSIVIDPNTAGTPYPAEPIGVGEF